MRSANATTGILTRRVFDTRRVFGLKESREGCVAEILLEGPFS